MKIYLIRHGEYDNPSQLMPGRSSGFPLTEKGIRQIRQAGQFLKDKDIAKIISSPLLRTKQTAEIIAQKISIDEIKYDNRLIELDVGDYTRQPLEKFEQSGFYQDMINTPTGIESISGVCDRTFNFLEEIRNRYSENLLIVTHVYSIRCFLCLINNTEIKSCFQYKPKMGEMWEIDSSTKGLIIKSVFPES